MDFVTAWRRRVLGAAGAGASVPVVIVAVALIVGVGGGGIAGIGALSQALTGPQIPDAEAAQRDGAGSGDATANDPSTLLASLDAVPGAGGQGANRVRRPRRGSDRNPQSGGNGPSGPGASPTPGPTPDPTAQPTPQPTPTPTPPSPIRQVGDRVKETVRPVPVVGPTAAEVVETLVTTIDELPPRR